MAVLKDVTSHPTLVTFAFIWSVWFLSIKIKGKVRVRHGNYMTPLKLSNTQTPIRMNVFFFSLAGAATGNKQALVCVGVTQSLFIGVEKNIQ